MSIEFRSHVKGGLPVLVRAEFYDGDVDCLDILTLRGKPAPWAKPTKADLQRLEVEAAEAISAQRRSDAEDKAEADACYWDDRRDQLRCEGRL